MAGTQPFRFLDLPAEIRMLVYENLFPRETDLIIRHGQWVAPSNNCNMLLTCKLIKHEAISYIPGMTLHLIYVWERGPDVAVIPLHLFPLVRRITFTGTPPKARIKLNGIAKWNYPRTMGGFTRLNLRSYINLQEVILTGNSIHIISDQVQGESVLELTAPDRPRNSWLCDRVFMKLMTWSHVPTEPTRFRKVEAVPGLNLGHVMALPYEANGANGARKYHVTIVCECDLYDTLDNYFRVVSVPLS